MPRKPKTNQPQTSNEIQGRDLFQTPNYAVDILIPFIPKNIKNIWEPAAGNGKIISRLEESKYIVYATDIRFDPDWIDETYNFVVGNEEQTIPLDIFDWFMREKELAIITNPPFSLKHKFYEKCLEFKVPFALLIPADYSGWIIKAVQDGAEKIIPTRRIDYITPTGKESHAQFHSMWLTWGFGLGKSETFVELTKEMKENI